MNKKVIIPIAAVIGTLVILTGTFFIYTSIYYHADKDRINAYISNKEVDIKEVDGHSLMINKGDSDVGIIFYPGAKVEHLAYEPLLASIAEEGYTCFLVDMPFKLAFFDTNAADYYLKSYPQITHWYLAGHSLGGVMASQYIHEHHDKFDGVIFLGSYPNKDLSKTSLRMLSIYGSEDKILNIDKYNDSKNKWPTSNEEYVIDGGCHSGFGMYGTQNGDGTPTITNEEQIGTTSDVIITFINTLLLDAE